MLPMAKGPLGRRLRGFDLAIVVGAQIFRYYPCLAGEYLPGGTELLLITSDPNDAGAAAVGDSLLGDTKLTLESLIQLLPQNIERSLPTPLPANAPLPSPANNPLTANEAFAALSELRPDNAVVVEATPSNS